jgi:hypothetical protein
MAFPLSNFAYPLSNVAYGAQTTAISAQTTATTASNVAFTTSNMAFPLSNVAYTACNTAMTANARVQSIYWASNTSNIITYCNVGVGMSNPSYRLDVVGDINYTGFLYNGGVNLAMWRTSGSNVCLIGSNVGIGTSTPAYPIEVQGANATGTSIYSSHDMVAYSDARAKTNLKRIDDAVAKVCAINGYTFNRADDSNQQPVAYAGVMAQEVQMVLPEVVRTDKDGMLNVAYGNMVALMIEAVKELTSRNDDLQHRVNALEHASGLPQ